MITHKTFFRHLLPATFLVLLLFILESSIPHFRVRELFTRNWLFLSLWFSTVILLGILADRTIRRRLPHRFFLGVLSRLGSINVFAYYREYQQGNSKLITNLIFKWGGCSRCVGWWLGLSISFLMHALYWPRWYAALYFMAMGASLSAAVAVFLYLKGRYDWGVTDP